MQPHEFWQATEPPDTWPVGPPYLNSFPALLPDGRQLLLPIRPLPDGHSALCSLIVNQTSFAVLDAIADHLARALDRHAPTLVVGLPTLGLTLAAAVAQRLGHPRYVPLGTSRKFWYDLGLSVPVSSVTTADEKRLYHDPRLRPLLSGQRIALIDDVISTGRSMAAGLQLLELAGAQPVVIGVAMLQSQRWQQAPMLAPWGDRLETVIRSPRLLRRGNGWMPE